MPVKNPDELIAELGVEGLCQSAEKYYQDKGPGHRIMAKPFGDLEAAPISLVKLGLLLDGLMLGKSMTVLDFGAGTCWLSKALWQLECRPIALDPSSSALELGRQLFKAETICQPFNNQPSFLVFDGRHIKLPDASVDRIACFDSFHHVPNRREVLAEFGRVLKPGGVAGFSEPGPGHSQSGHSQSEMRQHHVLERDVSPAELFRMAREHGFTHFYAKPFMNPNARMPLKTYKRLIRFKYLPPLSGLARLWGFSYPPMLKDPVFFISKGEALPDSRQHRGLRFELEGLPENLSGQAGSNLRLTLRIKNTGSARWLEANWVDVGVVKLGAHLYGADGQVENWDFLRLPLPHQTDPGGRLEIGAELALPEKGSYWLEWDMVSENVCWFADKGGQSKRVRLEVV
jgi:ubiquinone/menaquinone biosynthesis C-methylase UbiE